MLYCSIGSNLQNPVFLKLTNALYYPAGRLLKLASMEVGLDEVTVPVNAVKGDYVETS